MDVGTAILGERPFELLLVRGAEELRERSGGRVVPLAGQASDDRSSR